jgi:hypothetical protein
MDAVIVAARTVHFASAMLLFGGLLFAVAIATPAWRGAGRETLQRRQRLLSLALACGAWTLAAGVASAAIWLAAETAIMSGLPMAQAISGDAMGLVLSSTVVGRLWIWRLGLAVALGALLMASGRSASERRRLRMAVGQPWSLPHILRLSRGPDTPPQDRCRRSRLMSCTYWRRAPGSALCRDWWCSLDAHSPSRLPGRWRDAFPCWASGASAPLSLAAWAILGTLSATPQRS